MSRLANRVQKVTPSQTLAIEAKAKQMKQQGINVVSFSAGEPDFDTPDYIKEKTIESLKKGFTKYTPAPGTPELRESISKKLAAENGLKYDPSQIIVSCGAKHSIYNIFQVLLNEGDEVVFQSPFWLSYPEMATLAGAKSVIVPTTKEQDYKLSAAALEKAITPKTKLLVLNSPSNPTGAVLNKKELMEIAEVCKKKSIFVLSDEIYEKLVYDGEKHYSIGSFDEDILKLTITVNGASKAYAMTGWRLGYAACPKEIANAASSLQSHSTSNPTSFAQVGFLEAIKQGDNFPNQMREAYEVRRNLMVDLLNEIPGFSAFKPKGAFYVFCDISGTKMSSLDLSAKLLEEAKVAVVPGVAFGDDKAIRLSFATSETQIREGVKRIAEWFNKSPVSVKS